MRLPLWEDPDGDDIVARGKKKAMLGRASMQPDVSDVVGPTFSVRVSRLFCGEKNSLRWLLQQM